MPGLAGSFRASSIDGRSGDHIALTTSLTQGVTGSSPHEGRTERYATHADFGAVEAPPAAI
jgi:hypothetical protein